MNFHSNGAAWREAPVRVEIWKAGRHLEDVADYGEVEFARLMEDTGIVRNRLKVRAATQNAQAVLRLQD